MTGSGNDFVMVDGRGSTPADWTADDVRAVCARGTGIGADGLVFISPGSEPGAVRMVYLNSDGSRAAMCGNAALCSTHLATRLGLVDGCDIRLETDDGVYQSRCAASESRAVLILPPVDPPVAVPDLECAAEARVALVHVGVPHLVLAVDDVDCVDLRTRGPALRWDPALGPEGANVNYISPGSCPSEWRMRTYERGVEAETLACGTGAVAAACALDAWGMATLPVTIVTRSGRPLDVQARKLPSGQYGEVSLTGEARLVFRGVLL
jgi:diaminopimelate epimerase